MDKTKLKQTNNKYSEMFLCSLEVVLAFVKTVNGKLVDGNTSVEYVVT